MVVRVGDVDAALGPDRDAVRRVELCLGIAKDAPGFEELAVRRELLDAVVAGVGDVDVARLVDGDAPRGLELAGLGAWRAPGQHRRVGRAADAGAVLASGGPNAGIAAGAAVVIVGVEGVLADARPVTGGFLARALALTALAAGAAAALVAVVAALSRLDAGGRRCAWACRQDHRAPGQRPHETAPGVTLGE